MSLFNFYRPQRSCGQGYVFTRVCDSVNGGSPESPPRDQADTTTVPPGPGRPPLRRTPLGPRRTASRQGEPPPPWQGEPPQTKENPPVTRQTPPPPGQRRTLPPGPGRPPPGTKKNPPPGRRLQHTVSERPVRILLECILVFFCNLLLSNIYCFFIHINLTSSVSLD